MLTSLDSVKVCGKSADDSDMARCLLKYNVDG